MRWTRKDLICDECKKRFVVSRSVYYRRLKEPRILCTLCHINLVGKKSREVEEGKKKAKETCLQRYGVENPAQSKAVQEKTKRTNLKKYGVEWAIASKEVKEKIENSNLKNHGVRCTFNDPKQIALTRIRLLQKFGVDNAAKNNSVKDKIRRTNLERYGVEYVTQVPEIRSKQRAKHQYGDVFFDSWAEVLLYAILKKANVEFQYQKLLPEKYLMNSKEHVAIIDFYLPKTNEWIEIKGKHLLTNGKPIGVFGNWKEKYDLMMKYNVKVIIAEELISFLRCYFNGCKKEREL